MKKKKKIFAQNLYTINAISIYESNSAELLIVIFFSHPKILSVEFRIP